jgi:pyridoxal phosphate enzyme (YggS family)
MVAEQLKQVMDRIRSAAEACGRDPGEVRLVAVSKTVPAARVEEALAAGVTDLGENYIQEAREKRHLLSSYPASWHFIGRLQSNKAKYAVKIFDLIHSVDRLKLAQELDKQAAKMEKVQPILIQVNIAGEETKSGVREADLLSLIRETALLENVGVKGLMTMPPYFDDPEAARPFFAELRRLRDRIQEEGMPGVDMTELSMGMTGDFTAAIEEGATLVRIGTAIFGERS